MHRHEVLEALDYKTDGHDKPVTFSIKVRLKDGTLKFIAKGHACGVKGNMAANRLRGVQEVDEKGEKVSHPTPISIDRIIEFNGKKVYM